MKLKRILAAIVTMMVLVLASDLAFAQDPSAGPIQQLTPLTGVVLAGTFLVGFFGNSVATGKILGTWNLNTSLVPAFVLGGSFLTGALKVLASASAFSGTVLANALYMGGAAVLTATAGIAAHQHKSSADAQAKLRTAAKTVAAACLALVGFGMTTACKQANSVANEVAIIAVDLCKEVPALIPPGQAATIVALACQDVNAVAPLVNVLVPAGVWNGMKADYIAQHGALPADMSPVTK